MNKYKLIILIFSLIFTSCATQRLEKKGFSVNTTSEEVNNSKIDGINKDSTMQTRPRNVLMTGFVNHRLTPIYKVNYRKKKAFVGSNHFYSSYNYNNTKGNKWNNNFMPGFEAVYGYNFVNVTHIDVKSKTHKLLFENPVLIKTLYYPTLSKDTLNYKAVNRNYYMVSAYDEDTDNNGFINAKDLRRFYYFDINGNNKKLLIPKNYSVMNSEYDYVNDYMYVFARFDKNNNGIRESNEPIHVFWIDLNSPVKNGILYE